MHSVRFSVNKILATSESKFWIATSEGVYVTDTDKDNQPKRIYSEPADDIVAYQGLIYLATPTGLIAIDQHSQQLVSSKPATELTPTTGRYARSRQTRRALADF